MKLLLFSLLSSTVSAGVLPRHSTLASLVHREDAQKLSHALKIVRDVGAILDGPGGHSDNPRGQSSLEDVFKNTGSLLQGFIAPLAPVRSVDVPPQLVKTAFRKKVRYGPLEAKANGVSSLSTLHRS